MGSVGSLVGDMVEDGFNFLLDCVVYWDRLGLLLFLLLVRRFWSCFSGSMMFVNFMDSYKIMDSKSIWKFIDFI